MTVVDRVDDCDDDDDASSSSSSRVRKSACEF